MSTVDAVGNLHDQAGRFAGHQQNEGDPDQLLIRRHKQDVLDDPLVVEALGGAQLDEQEQRGLRMVLDPANDASGAGKDLAERIRLLSGYHGPDDVRNVAACVRAAWEREEGYGAFDVEFLDCGDGVESFNVTRQLPGSQGFSISMRGDSSELGQGWDGVRAAAVTAGCLNWYHDQIADEVNRRFPDVRCEHAEKMTIRNGRTVCLGCGTLIG